MSLAFGLCFELPIAILLLAVLGIVTPEFLRRFRRHALVLCVVTGALLSPGDLIWTTMLLAAPLYLLYELSVILTALVYRESGSGRHAGRGRGSGGGVGSRAGTATPRLRAVGAGRIDERVARLVTLPAARAGVRRWFPWMAAVPVVAALLLRPVTAPRAGASRHDCRRDTTARRDTVRAPGDTLQRDSTAKFPGRVGGARLRHVRDAVARGLHGDQVSGRARRDSREGQVPQVVREGRRRASDAILAGDTVIYNDSLDIVTAIGVDTTKVGAAGSYRRPG
jgi:hypothetical protein